MNHLYRCCSFLSPIVFSFLSASANGSSPTERYCVGYKNIQFVNLVSYRETRPGPLAPVYSCADFIQFDELGGRINALVGYENPSTDILPIANVLESQDSYGFGHLSFGFDKNKKEFADNYKAVFVHEWAHALLVRYLTDNLALFSELRALLQESDETFPTLLTFMNLTGEDGVCKSDVCREFADKNSSTINRTSEVAKEINKLMRHPEVQRFFQISAHYQEFFADFVAAVFFDDPGITARSLDALL